MTLHKRGGAQSCLDYRHGVSSYCAGLNALAGSRCRLCLNGGTTSAPASLLCNNHNAILERERIPNPSSWKPDERQRLVCRGLIINVASLPVTRKRLEPPGESLT